MRFPIFVVSWATSNVLPEVISYIEVILSWVVSGEKAENQVLVDVLVVLFPTCSCHCTIWPVACIVWAAGVINKPGELCVAVLLPVPVPTP